MVETIVHVDHGYIHIVIECLLWTRNGLVDLISNKGCCNGLRANKEAIAHVT